MSYNLPDTSYRTQVFYQSGQWIKPQGISMVYITLIGAGSGGGGGPTSASGVGSNGGGGGGSGAITRVMISSDLLEDRLNVTVGRGGAGGDPNSDGAVGGTSSVIGTSSFLGGIMNAEGSGTAGTTTGNGGGAGQATTIQSASLASMGVFISTTGLAGSSSGIPNVTYGTFPITGGAAGGIKDASNNSTNGGNIIGAGIVPNFSGGTSGGTNGISSQINTLAPLIFLGGTGGGGNGTGTGGNGGDGGIGCGGGGGGAGITGGRGGRGGDGLVIINCW